MDLHILYRKLKRYWLRRMYGIKCAHPTALLSSGSSIAKDLQIEKYAYIGPGCRIAPRVKIGKYTMLANNVMIVGGDHNFHNPSLPIIFSGREEEVFTYIGDDCWIGAGSIVKAGVTIGDGSIVAAGAVVTKDIPPYTIYGGCPAKLIRRRFSPKDEQKYINSMKSFNYTDDELDNMMVSGRAWSNKDMSSNMGG